MKKFIWGIFGGFYGNDGLLSISKVMAFFGYLVFLVVSIIVLYTSPEKFDYITFAILTAGSSSGMRMLDKHLNCRNNGGNNDGQSTSL